MKSSRQPPGGGDAVESHPHDEPASARPSVPRRGWGGLAGRRAAAVVGAWTLVGAAQAAVRHASARDELASATLHESLVPPLAAAWAWAALTPAIVWLTRRLAQRRAGWREVVLGHTVGVLVACAVLTAARVVAIVLLGGEPLVAIRFAFWVDVNVATYLLVAAGVRAVDLHRGYAARMRRAIRLEAQLARARLQFLQRQLQPHFLFNALNATAELTREAPEAAQRMLGHLARLLRAAVEQAGDGEVSLRAELATLEPYVEVQRTRFGDAFDFATHVPPVALDARVPSLLLQPLVENAFRHGLAGRDHGRVRVHAALVPGPSGTRLQLAVLDDGVGSAGGDDWRGAGARTTSSRTTDARTTGARRSGIGLRNTRDRLRQLYGDDFRFELRQSPGTGTVAELEIPFRVGAAEEPEADTRFDTAEYAAVSAAAARAAEAAAGRSGAAPDGAHGSASRSGDGRGPAPAVDDARAEPMEDPWRDGARDGAGNGAAARRGRGVPAWAGLAALWLCAAGFWTLQIWALQLIQDGRITDWLGSRRDVLGAVQWALLTPLVLWLSRRFRLTRRTWARYLPLHLAAAAVVDVAHLTAMWRAFDPALPLFSLQSVSPLTVNFVIYAALVAWAHARDFGAWMRDRELADPRLEAALAHARWQALALELRPQLVLTVLGVAARLAPEDPERAERLIERLSDLLRAVLDASTSAESSGTHAADAAGWRAQALRHELAVFGACAELLAEAAGHEAQVSLDADPTALDANVPPGAFGPLLDALVDALLAEALLADAVVVAEAGAPALVGAASGPERAAPPPARPPVRLGVLARATPGGVRVTVRADAPLFARPSATWTAATSAPTAAASGPAFPDAYTAVLDLTPDSGLATLTPISGIIAR